MLLDLLQALGTGKTGWSLHAKTLRIRRGREAGHQELVALPVSKDEMKDLLASALRSIPKIRTVVWEVHEHAEQDPSAWEKCTGTICKFLNTSKSLDELQLDIQGIVDVSSLKVRSLRKFTLKSPRWQSRFDFSWMTPPLEPPMYANISQVVAQNQLTSLHLEGTDKWAMVWSTLRTNSDESQVKLTEITTNVVTSGLFDYLSSYSGIEKLTLLYPDGGSRNNSDHLADMFFGIVLPHHATSLVELSCSAGYESRFSFGTHNVDVISQLRKLKSLEMSINAGVVRRVDTPDDVWIDEDGTKIPIVSIGISVEAEQADIDPVVMLLLETAATLPALCSLTINSAETESNRGAWCGNGRIHHTGAVDAAIEKAMQAFRSNVPCSVIVRAGNHRYELELLSEVDLAKECHSYADPEMLGYQQKGWFSRF
ncbi:hypothetical protein C8J57DRAFT_1730900 [Mycena rebaudengoi]|nr:hypothetical protein C8J57DRAFT_1730900 [Mycena rebaudengoi]